MGTPPRPVAWMVPWMKERLKAEQRGQTISLSAASSALPCHSPVHNMGNRQGLFRDEKGYKDVVFNNWINYSIFQEKINMQITFEQRKKKKKSPLKKKKKKKKKKKS